MYSMIERVGVPEILAVVNKRVDGKYKEIAERDNFKCIFCSSDINLVIHHIDRNPKNNLSNNLIVVCRKCHARVHGYSVCNDINRIKRSGYIVDRFLMGYTFTEIAKTLNISRQRTHQLFKKEMAKL